MSDPRLEGLTPEQLTKLGDSASRLVLSRTLADVLYAVRANLPAEQVGQHVEKFLDRLDSYIDYRTSGVLMEVLKDFAAHSERPP